MAKYVKSKVILNNTAIAKLTNASIVALELTGDYVYGEVVEAQVMPFDKGTMQNEGTYVDKSNSSAGNVSIVSTEPYARRLYYHPEYLFDKSNNPNAKGLWLEDWTEKGKYAKEVITAYKHFFKQLGGL